MAIKTIETALCQQCGVEFEKVTSRQRFHSPACRRLSLRKLAPEAIPEARRQAAIKGGQSRSRKKVQAARENWRKYRPGRGQPGHTTAK